MSNQTHPGQKGPLHLREINRARQFYNPLTGLDIPRLRALLEQGERGLNSQLQDFYRIAEKRFSTLLALKTRRVGEVKKLDWDIKIPARLPRGINARQADAQANYLRDTYEQIENLPEAFESLAVASFRGYTHLEKHFADDDPNLPIVKLQNVPQWHMLRSQEDWGWVYDPTARNNVSTAQVIDRANFVIREVEAPLNEIGGICFVRASLGEKDWVSFIEDFGLPSIFASLAPTTPIDKVKEWLAVVEKVTGNSRGALPPGAVIEMLESANGDGGAFEKFLAHQDQVIVLAGTCGLLTMLTAAGSGTLAGGAHQEAFEMVGLAEAMEISSILQSQIDKPTLQREFPSQRQAAYFTLAALDEEDLNALADRLAKLKSAGLVADAEEISEKLGITLERDTVVAPGGLPGQADNTPLKNRADPAAATSAGAAARFMANAEAMLSDADRAVLQPVIARVAPIRAELVRIADLDDVAFAAGLESLRPQLRALQAALPDLEKQVLTGRPDLEEAFTDIIGTAFLSGAAEASEARQTKFKEGGRNA